MKTQTIGLLAILSLGVGLTGLSSSNAFQGSSDIDTYGESTPISGHVTLVHRDSQDNILAYHQYDNIIVNEGLSCITELTFGTSNSTTCGDGAATAFNEIGLLGSTPSIVATDNAASITTVVGGGLDVITATTIGVDVEGDGSGATQGKSVTAIQHEFTKSNATAATIGGATLENAANDKMFAAKAFTGGDVTLNESDTLEVTWSIQIGA